MGVITFNGRRSDDYGIVVEHPPKYVAAEQNFSKLSIPGRNGQLFFSMNKTYGNVDREYEISFYNGEEKMEVLAHRASSFLHSANGYARLEDTYDPTVFMQALYVEEFDVENILFYAGRATVRFNCKPQRFLKSGETEIEVTGNMTITNPTFYPSLPKLRIYGVGTVTIGSQTITVGEHSYPYIDIDTETMNAQYDGNNCNSLITYNTTDQIKLQSGSNGIALGDGITMVKVTPMWWIL